MNSKGVKTRKFKNTVRSSEYSENESIKGRKRKHPSNLDLQMPSKSKKKKGNYGTDDTEVNILNRITQEDSSSQIVKRIKTRSNKLLNTANVEEDTMYNEENIENISEPLKVPRKGKKKVKESLQDDVTNCEMVADDVSIATQVVPLKKHKKKTKVEIGEIHIQNDQHIETSAIISDTRDNFESSVEVKSQKKQKRKSNLVLEPDIQNTPNNESNLNFVSYDMESSSATVEVKPEKKSKKLKSVKEYPEDNKSNEISLDLTNSETLTQQKQDKKQKKKNKFVEELMNVNQQNHESLYNISHSEKLSGLVTEKFGKKLKKKMKLVDGLNTITGENNESKDFSSVSQELNAFNVSSQEKTEKKQRKKVIEMEVMNLQDGQNIEPNDFHIASQERNISTLHEKPEKKRRKKYKPNEQLNQELPNFELNNGDATSKETNTFLKEYIKFKTEHVDEIESCSQKERDVLAEYLPSIFGEPDSTFIVDTDNTTVEEANVAVNKYNKTKASQLVPKTESVIEDHNSVFDEDVSNESQKSKKKEKTIDIDQKDNSSLIDIKEELNILTLNNNDVGMKANVNIIDIKNEPTGDNTEKVVHISISDGGETLEDNDLLQQLEKKLMVPPKKTHNSIWPQSDLENLLSRMELCIPQNDSVPFLKRLDKLEWDTIAFNNYSVEQCKNTWLQIQKKIRRYRLLNEVLQDAKEWIKNVNCKTKVKKKGLKPPRHPDMPRKPLTAYFIFYLEHRDKYQKNHVGVDAAEVAKALAQEFQSLTPEEKKKYIDEAIRRKNQYVKDIAEFYKNHPEISKDTSKQKVDKTPKSSKSPNNKSSPKVPKEKPPPKEKSAPKDKTSRKIQKEKPSPKPPKDKTPTKPHPPFQYYYLSELEKENVADKVKFKELCKENWKNMPERNKLVWIHYAEAETMRYKEEMEEYMKKHPDYTLAPFKSVLKREDIELKERAAGKPVKPPASAYNLFASTMFHNDSIKDVPIKERLLYVSNQWKFCSEEEKNRYKEKFEEMVKKYQEDYPVYLESLPEEQRQAELAKNVPKKPKPDKEKMKLPPKKKEVKKKQTSNKTVKKVENKPEEKKEKMKEPEQPPISAMKYFATTYTGEEPVVQAWKALSKEQKVFYKEELDKKKKQYIEEFEKFLKSMTKEELAEFSLSRKRIKEQQEQENQSEEEDSDSEESENDEAESSEEDEDE